jgi:hypothetical protein
MGLRKLFGAGVVALTVVVIVRGVATAMASSSVSGRLVSGTGRRSVVAGTESGDVVLIRSGCDSGAAPNGFSGRAAVFACQGKTSSGRTF